jgi:hypothetical protein
LERTLLLLVDVPRMLRDIVVELAAESGDFDIAAEVVGADVVDALRSTGADFVIGGRIDERLVAALLDARPVARVLTVSDNGRDGTLHELAVRTTWMGELSLDRLLAIARSGGRLRGDQQSVGSS